MDFVAAWKAISIALTGAFGILGLLTEFKDKGAKKITKWGWISLVGIVVSSVFGVAAQLKESSNDAAKALLLAEKSDKTLTDLQRVLTPLSDPQIELSYIVDCFNPGYTQMCRNEVPGGNASGPMEISIQLFSSSEKANTYLKFGMSPMGGDLMLSASTKYHAHMDQPDGILHVKCDPTQAKTILKELAMKSYLDLIGSTMIIQLKKGNQQVDGAKRWDVKLRFNDGTIIMTEYTDFETITVRGDERAYRYTFRENNIR